MKSEKDYHYLDLQLLFLNSLLIRYELILDSPSIFSLLTFDSFSIHNISK